MNITRMQQNQWPQIKEIYLEAFPKRERKPFYTIRRSVKRGKIQIFTATEETELLGFAAVIPYRHMVMVDYLAVSGKIRSKGTGSQIMQALCKQFSNKKIVLLIERLDETAENYQQRIARRKFYFKNGFDTSNLFITGTSGDMEILTFGDSVSAEEYLTLQQYALGKFFFRLSKIKLISNE